MQSSANETYSDVFLRSDGLPVAVFIELLEDIEKAGGFTEYGMARFNLRAICNKKPAIYKTSKERRRQVTR